MVILWLAMVSLHFIVQCKTPSIMTLTSLSFFLSLTPTHSINDNDSCADLLLERMEKEAVDTQDGGGRTAVHAAAFNNHVECMQLLLRYNAKVSIADNSGRTPVMMAADAGHASVLSMDNNLLVSVITYSSLDVLMGLPLDQLSLESTDQQNNSALHLASLKVIQPQCVIILYLIYHRVTKNVP